MSLETRWFHFEIAFPDADTVSDKIPADTEAEARATLRRIYPGAHFIRLTRTEVRETVMGRFDPTTANRRFSRPSKGATHQFVCPKCGTKVAVSATTDPSMLQCPACTAPFEAQLSGKNLVVLFQEPASSEVPKPADHQTPPHWHEVLEVDPDATMRQIRTAYLEQVKQYHPDKVSHLGAKLIRLAEETTAELNQALEAAVRSRVGPKNQRTAGDPRAEHG